MVSVPKVIEFPIEEAYIKTYKLRFARVGAETVEVSIPRDFLRRMARNVNLTLSEFVDQYRAIVYFGVGEELLYRFEKANKVEEGSQ